MDERKENSYQQLVALLQLAYSAELAAALAYRGHWNSVADPDERARILQIENEEWHHRELVGEMLQSLGESPNKQRERRSWWIGKVLAFLCHVMGWFAPMYGAGRLESGNVREYETAARHARDCGHEEFVECFTRWGGDLVYGRRRRPKRRFENHSRAKNNPSPLPGARASRPQLSAQREHALVRST
jgi:hypothetical protein